MKIKQQIVKMALLFVMLLHYSNVMSETDARSVIKKIKLPPGFKISLFADDVPNARALALGDDGVVFVGSVGEGKVYALQDKNQDGVAEKKYIIASDLFLPNGVAYRNGSLYVAEVSRILRFDRIAEKLSNPPEPKVVYDKFPDKTHHGWKYLRFGPDGKLYTAVGAPCNICDPEQEIFTSLVRLNPDGSDFEIIARGIRNTVGFDWHPGTGALFFTENGRDYLGDDLPPEELNKWSKKGDHFGYPFCHAGTISDPEFGKLKNCDEFVSPVWTFKAHMAPLGARFYQGRQFPEEFRGRLFVAQHGSWNRTVPHGYRVVAVNFTDGMPDSELVFAEGWLTQEKDVLGRPVDFLEMPDGSLLVSDDRLGVVYKITYKKGSWPIKRSSSK